MFKHICVATDGSAASEHAATLAASLARTHGASLTALYVIDPYPFLMVGETNPMGFQSYMSAAHGLATNALAKLVAVCQNGSSPLDVQTRVVEDMAAAPGIVQAAQAAGCDLIVLGSHGRSGIRRLMLGSVCSRVVAESPIPVLVTR
jgi:nucleotide-binding universal stress UspA family protein